MSATDTNTVATLLLGIALGIALAHVWYTSRHDDDHDAH